MSPVMTIGATREIKLEWYKTAKDASGNNVESVYKRISMWAGVKRIGGGRTTRSGQTALENSIEFIIYYRPSIFPTGNWRVVYDGRKHTVQSIVKDSERRFFWRILAISEGKK